MKSIIIMIPYFGKLPPFFMAWKETAIRNKSIDFVLFTDDMSVSTQENIRVVHMTWKDFVARVQSIFSFPVALKAPYKICDFKPALGEIFYEYIKDYDCWGYGDIDLLLGDLRAFITDEVLGKYERVFYYGHVSLYRNCDKMNSLWRYQEDDYPAVNYQECYSSRRAFFFDEYGAMYAKCLINQINVFDDVDHRRDPIVGLEKFYWKNQHQSSQFVVSWENGKLYAIHGDKKIELIYAHFYRRKFNVNPKPETVERIVVVPNEVRYNDSIIDEDFQKAEPGNYRWAYFWRSAKGILKRDGLFGVFEKRKRDRHYEGYCKKLEEQYIR